MSVGYVNTRDDHNSIVSLIFIFSILFLFLFTLVPPSPDNRGSTVPVSESFWINFKVCFGVEM